MNGVYQSYLQYRQQGCSQRAASQLAAKLYGRTSEEDVRSLEVTMCALEERDTPKGAAGPPIQVPADNLVGVYLAERRGGKSHTEAREAASHSSGHRGQGLDQQLERPRAKFERETRASAERPADVSQSTTTREIAA
jgi:hypothetical protein